MSDLAKLLQIPARSSAKWRRYDPDILPMHVAEMDFEVDSHVRAKLIEMVTNSDLGYLGPIPELGAAFAGFAERRWGWKASAAEIKLAGDVGIAAVEIFRAISKPGQKVLINSPVYTNFYTWTTEAKLEIVDVPLINEESKWVMDLERIEAAFKSGVKFYLICNPHNPVGKVYSREELVAVANLSNKYSVRVISDEIHGPLTYVNEKFVPYLSIPEGRENGIVITSASKSWNFAGLKAALINTQNPALFKELEQMAEATHWRSGLLGAIAMTTAFAQADAWLDETLIKIERNARSLVGLLERELPGVKYLPPQSSYLAWLDFSALDLGENPAEQLMQRGRVALNPGTEFGASYKNHLRLNFATTPRVLEEGIARIKRAVNS